MATGSGAGSGDGLASSLAVACEVTNRPSAARTGAGKDRLTTRRRGEAAGAASGAAACMSVAAALA
jgi:hypothetical protein